MSTMYGGGGYADAGPPRQVSFSWIGEAFNLFGASAGLWLLATVVYALLPIIAYALAMPALTAAMVGLQQSGSFNPNSPGASFALLSALPVGYIVLLIVFSLVYTPFLYASLFRMAAKQVRGEALVAGDIFGGGPQMLPMLGLTFLVGLAGLVLQFVFSLVLGGAHLATVVPGPGGRPAPSLGGGAALIFLVYLAVLLVFYTVILPCHALVADGEGPVTALRRGIAGMAADLGHGALLVFLFGLVLFLSIIPCGLGLLVTLPMLYLLSALAYRDMVGMPGMGTPAAVSYGTPQAGVWPPPPASGQAPPPNWGGLPGRDPPGGGEPPAV